MSAALSAQIMNPNKETFSVSLLHAKRSIACAAWWFKQFERTVPSTKMSSKGFAAHLVWRLCSAKFYADQIIQICTSGDKNDFWADFDTYYFACVNSWQRNIKNMYRMWVYQLRIPSRYFQIDPTASRHVQCSIH